ncbi:MAG TPA: hypothetical protein VFE30_19320 [Anaeromyxobacteraceae bacterium]|jgi:hypothetical protein|nr:hypothetical protein [Anaeromyxobacteraceae bacterium]
MSQRSQIQAETARINGARSHGPKSIEGRTKVGMNAVRTGIRARRVLLPTESVESYADEAKTWVESLCPETDAETEVVLDIVDARVCLGRLELAEKRRLEAALREAMEVKTEVKRLHSIDQAIAGLDAMKKTVEAMSAKKISNLGGFISAAEKVVEMAKAAEDLDITLVPGLDALGKAMVQLGALAEDSSPDDLFRSLAGLAHLVEEELHRRRDRDLVTVRNIETELAREAVPRSDPDSRRLDLYRRQLDRRLEALFDRLEALRRLRPTSSGSFDRPVEVHLRRAPAPAPANLACQ